LKTITHLNNSILFSIRTRKISFFSIFLFCAIFLFLAYMSKYSNAHTNTQDIERNEIIKAFFSKLLTDFESNDFGISIIFIRIPWKNIDMEEITPKNTHNYTFTLQSEHYVPQKSMIFFIDDIEFQSKEVARLEGGYWVTGTFSYSGEFIFEKVNGIWKIKKTVLEIIS